ncbi:ribonuclease M5 [Convivina intestini]|uniref:ribonuclease M5 n=1 Tax=Convivina intestini TaxID=1505726 RepID=UPI00200D53FB|nr:ribonuclease M5 [Convivina intestini]CAH1850508.1 Ribonuclease M5 [Convivina intestini]
MTDTFNVKEFIVVEGRSDTQNLRRLGPVETIETGGSALNQATIQTIKHAVATRGAIIFTDPDFNGERLRRLITQQVPGVKQAYISQGQGRAHRDNPHKSLGVEHASLSVLKKALQQAASFDQQASSDVTPVFLQELGLIGGPLAAQYRQELGMTLKIGHTNGKQLYRKLQAFGISQAEVLRVMKGIYHG